MDKKERSRGIPFDRSFFAQDAGASTSYVPTLERRNDKLPT